MKRLFVSNLLTLGGLFLLLSPFSIAQTLPDLKIEDIYLDSLCYVHVKASNVGGNIPTNITGNLIITVELNGKDYGFKILSMEKLRDKNSSTEEVIKSNHSAEPVLSPGFYSVTAEIHGWQVSIPETTNARKNNSITKSLNCTRRLPDLVVQDIKTKKISFNGDCEVKAIIKNRGGQVPPLMRGVPLQVQFIKGGRDNWAYIPLERGLRPGSKLEVMPLKARDPFTIPPGKSATVTVVVDTPYSFVTESNENNNSFTKTIFCPKFISPPVKKPSSLNKGSNIKQTMPRKMPGTFNPHIPKTSNLPR